MLYKVMIKKKYLEQTAWTLMDMMSNAKYSTLTKLSDKLCFFPNSPIMERISKFEMYLA